MMAKPYRASPPKGSGLALTRARRGSATDGGVLRTVEHARRHFSAAKTPQDARTMATSRIVPSRLARRGDGACAVLTRASLTQRRWHAGPQTQKPALPRSRCKAASHLFRLA